MKNKIGLLTVLHAMNKFSLILIALNFLLPVGSFIQSQEKDNSIKVMSFNIRYGTANDGANSWQYRRENLIKVIKDAAPDIIGLQEALDFQNQELLKEFSNFALIGVGRDDGIKAGEFSPILYDANRFEADTSGTFWFSETPSIPGSKNWGNNITRICSWGRFTDKLTGKKFYFYNLHIDHESQPSREKSTELLIKKISARTDGLPIILTGDFNCGEDNSAVQNVLNYGLADTYRILHPKDENEGTFNGFNGDTSGEKIDFIFISKQIKCIGAEIIRTNLDGKYPSDHFPVTAELYLD